MRRKASLVAAAASWAAPSAVRRDLRPLRRLCVSPALGPRPAASLSRTSRGVDVDDAVAASERAPGRSTRGRRAGRGRRPTALGRRGKLRTPHAVPRTSQHNAPHQRRASRTQSGRKHPGHERATQTAPRARSRTVLNRKRAIGRTADETTPRPPTPQTPPSAAPSEALEISRHATGA